VSGAVERSSRAMRLLHGRPEPPVERLAVRAGPVAAELDGVDLRYISRAGVEAVRRVYVAVRDPDWNTIPAAVEGVEVEAGADGFRVTFDARHENAAIDFGWRGTITGDGRGEIVYSMEGRGHRDFEYNRIGFCILHPFDECAGQTYRGRGRSGVVSGRLPELIGPQEFHDGAYHALFPPFDRLELELRSGARVELQLEGDLFETEDQRNWTDASFKTYCTPLALGYPHRARRGQLMTQRVTIRVGDRSPARSRPRRRPGPAELAVGPPTGTVPRLGLALASAPASAPPRAADRLRALRLDHLRLDLRLDSSEWPDELGRGERAAAELGCALELALFVTDRDGDALAALADRLSPGATIARMLVFAADAESTTPTETTPPGLVAMARERLNAGAAPIGGGTDMNFCELNRTRPDAAAMDVVAWPIVAQVHAFDERSMMETLEAQPETVVTARSFAPDRPLAVTPITLLPRFNPHMRRSNGEPGDSPAPADPRQASLFGAAWTVGSIGALAAAGAASLTFYETVGPRGVLMEDEALPPYHVFADLAARGRAPLLRCAPGDPLSARGIALEAGEGARVLAANLEPRGREVLVSGLSGTTARVRRLDEATVELAVSEPERFGAESSTEPIDDGALRLELGPYAVATIDAAPARRAPGPRG